MTAAALLRKIRSNPRTTITIFVCLMVPLPFYHEISKGAVGSASFFPAATFTFDPTALYVQMFNSFIRIAFCKDPKMIQIIISTMMEN